MKRRLCCFGSLGCDAGGNRVSRSDPLQRLSKSITRFTIRVLGGSRWVIGSHRKDGMPMCVQNQAVYTESLTGLPFEGEPFLRFRLLYSGQLLGASRSDPRATLKHAVRKEFSPQLLRLWDTHQGLLTHTRDRVYETATHGTWEKHAMMRRDNLEILLEGRGIIAKQYERYGQGFIPLVTEEMEVRCALDILFLRPENPGFLLKSGDIDNRIKTLFDALRMPKDHAETGGATVEPDPIYCLLEDDKLITDIKVSTDRLLLLPHERRQGPNDVFLVIDVQLFTTHPRSAYSWLF